MGTKGGVWRSNEGSEGGIIIQLGHVVSGFVFGLCVSRGRHAGAAAARHTPLPELLLGEQFFCLVVCRHSFIQG